MLDSEKNYKSDEDKTEKFGFSDLKLSYLIFLLNVEKNLKKNV